MAHGGSVISGEAVRLKALDGAFFFSSELVDIIMTIFMKVKSLVQFNGAWQEGLGALGMSKQQRRVGARAAACGARESWSCPAGGLRPEQGSSASTGSPPAPVLGL